MASNYIISVGTSIFGNIKRYFKDLVNEEEINEFKNLEIKNEEEIENKAKKLFEKIKNHVSLKNIKELSAELNGIDSLSPPIDNENDKLFLFSTNTPDGIGAAYLNKFIFEEKLNIPSENIEIIKIKGTDVKSRYNIFKTQGIPNIFNNVAKIKEISDSEDRDLHINVSGGFKPISTMLTVAGLLLNIEVQYIYEKGDLIRIPKFPIGINWENLDSETIFIFKKVFEQEPLHPNEIELIKNDNMLKILTLVEKDKYKISELGKVVYRTLVNELFFSEDSDIFVLRRDSFEKFVENILDKNKNNYLIAIFDLDKFKNINDSYGHDVGDEALKTFAKTIDSIDYEYKMFGRIGGDEFMGIFWNLKDKEDGEKIVKEIQEKVKNATLYGNRLDNKKSEEISLSTTIGAYFFNTNEMKDINFEDLKKIVDTELMKLKKENRRGEYILL